MQEEREHKITPKEVLANPENFICNCRFINCPLRGDCAKCMTVHRYFKVLPGCMEDVTEKMD
jgi:hypothetical protein